MSPKRMSWGLGAALLVSVALSAAGAGAADPAKKGKDWENTFNGHELWIRSLDVALARSQNESKPLLIDFYSHT